MIQWIKVWWHCLINFHCKCTITGTVAFKKHVHHFCECGYNNDGKSWKDVKKEHGIG